MEKTFALQSTITCPDCGFQKKETMPARCLSILLKVYKLWHNPETNARWLLRILQLRNYGLPASTTRQILLYIALWSLKKTEKH